MIKRICFFSTGFAFNRLIRMRYYERIFPKEVKIFLVSTDKYSNKEKEKEKWNLERAEVHILDYSAIGTPFKLRKFCMKNNIERIVNLGAPGSGIAFIISTLLTDKDYLMGYYGEVVKHRRARNLLLRIKKFLLLYQYLLVGFFAKKLVFTDIDSYEKAHLFFMKSRARISYAAAPVNTRLFVPKNRTTIRKKLKLQKNKKIILRVGRINYGKCGDILIKLVEKNQDVQFILIGEWFESEVPKIKADNLLHIEKKSSKELVDYYNLSDLSFCLHRHGNGIGITAEESLACGTPVILPKTLTMRNSSSIIKTSHDLDEVNSELKKFLSLGKKQVEKIRKEARCYAQKYCSDDAWKKEFIKFHLI